MLSGKANIPGMRQIIRAALVLLAMTHPALADGKMYWTEIIPPTIPYQRALILFKDIHLHTRSPQPPLPRTPHEMVSIKRVRFPPSPALTQRTPAIHRHSPRQIYLRSSQNLSRWLSVTGGVNRLGCRGGRVPDLTECGMFHAAAAEEASISG